MIVLDDDELAVLIRAADILICHGGTNTAEGMALDSVMAKLKAAETASEGAARMEALGLLPKAKVEALDAIRALLGAEEWEEDDGSMISRIAMIVDEVYP